MPKNTTTDGSLNVASSLSDNGLYLLDDGCRLRPLAPETGGVLCGPGQDLLLRPHQVAQVQPGVEVRIAQEETVLVVGELASVDQDQFRQRLFRSQRDKPPVPLCQDEDERQRGLAFDASLGCKVEDAH